MDFAHEDRIANLSKGILYGGTKAVIVDRIPILRLLLLAERGGLAAIQKVKFSEILFDAEPIHTLRQFDEPKKFSLFHKLWSETSLITRRPSNMIQNLCQQLT